LWLKSKINSELKCKEIKEIGTMKTNNLIEKL